jgi:hypothetical protein
MTPDEMAAVKTIARALQAEGAEPISASLSALALLNILRCDGFTFTRIAPAAPAETNSKGGSS